MIEYLKLICKFVSLNNIDQNNESVDKKWYIELYSIVLLYLFIDFKGHCNEYFSFCVRFSPVSRPNILLTNNSNVTLSS